MSHNDALADLAAKLEEHRAQLATVETLLLANPNDTECRKLRDDLKQVISLTEELTKGNEASGSGRSAVASAAPEEVKFKEGDRVRAMWEDGQLYPARVDSVSSANTYLVTYLQYGTAAEVPGSAVKPYIGASKASLTKGVKVWAVYEDGLMYDAVVESPLPNGKFRVKFTKYSKMDVDQYDMVVQPRTMQDEAQLSDKPFIPDTLRILPTDSDKVKLTKKKKIKRIKLLHKEKMEELLSNQRKQSWQDFTKGIKKGKSKASIFASPDSVDGKVGVVNSGKAMTEFENPAKFRVLPGAQAMMASVATEDEDVEDEDVNVESGAQQSDMGYPS